MKSVANCNEVFCICSNVIQLVNNYFTSILIKFTCNECKTLFLFAWYINQYYDNIFNLKYNNKLNTDIL